MYEFQDIPIISSPPICDGLGEDCNTAAKGKINSKLLQDWRGFMSRPIKSPNIVDGPKRNV